MSETGGVRRFLASPAGKVSAVLLAVVALAAAVYSIRSSLTSETPDTAFSTMFIDTQTGQTFRHENKLGETLPIESPYTHKNTGVPAEPCYWTADGGTKKDPTWVLLNSLADRPGPTFCPDCHRLVIGRNPEPSPGRSPPPTESEYNAKHGLAGQ